ncbi:MAG: hypothetical protein ACM3WT_06225 [Bacillota bacterium]
MGERTVARTTGMKATGAGPAGGKSAAVLTVFGLLLAVTLAGILYHQVSGYDYPASPPFSFELNVLGDLYEAFFLAPLGVAGMVATHRGDGWGPVLIAGVAVNLTYNYAMAVTGRQNLWIFLWVAKLALAGTTLCTVWPLLPPGRGLAGRSRWAVAGYLTLVAVAFLGMMGRRLLASATGRMMEMTMQESGAVDWGEPVLRDPVIFFSFVLPLLVAAVVGLPRGTAWGGRATSLACAFIVSIVTIILFTGLLKEALLTGGVTPAMWATSAFMALVAVPPAWFLTWFSRDGRMDPQHPRG